MSDITNDAPTVTNDSGTGRDGTRIDEAWNDSLLSAINVQVLSATNPTITPADIIDEMVDLRGSEASADARMDAEHNEDGTHKNTGVIATLVTEVEVMGGIGAVNLLRNDDFQLWPDGDAAAPLYWPLTGAAATVARTGTGLADTSRKVGDFACKLTRNGTNCYIENILLGGAAFTRADFLQGKYLAFGIWVKCSTPNIARVAVYDGIGRTYSSYHAGAGSFVFLPVTRQLDSSATEATVECWVDTSDGNAVFSGATAMLLGTDFDLVDYKPTPQIPYGALQFSLNSDLAVANNQGRIVLSRGGIVKDVQVLMKTAPVGAAAIFDINTWDGAAYTTMFATPPEVADGANPPVGGAQPDGTYARRCLRGTYGNTMGAGGSLTIDVDQIGIGVLGADAAIDVRAMQYGTPLERFLDYNG